MPTSSDDQNGVPVVPRDRDAADAVLQTNAIVAGYGDVVVIDRVDIRVRPGELAVIVGPNGAGKSTLLKSILGLARVFDGNVLFEGSEITRRSLEDLVRDGIGYVPQVEDVFTNLRVSENLEMGGYLLDAKARAAQVEAVLEIFPPLKRMMRRYVRTLSGGEQKMTAVGRALMLSPRLLILDEPTAGLSPELTRVVLEEQALALTDHGTAVLLVEQKAKIALELAHWAYVMVRGRVEQSGSGSDVLSDPTMGEVFLGGGSIAPGH